MSSLILLLLALTFIAIGSYRLVREIRERRKAERQLKEALLEKDRLLFTVAHDLNNPLTVISMLAEQIDGSPEDRQRGSKIASLAQRSGRLIRQLISVKKLDQENKDLTRETVDVNSVLMESVQLSQVRASDKNLSLRTGLPDETLYIKGNRDALCQVLDNLISNAIKFSPEGGRIRVVLKLIRDEVIIYVKDQGPGIEEEDQDKLWKEFTRLSHSSTAEEISMGLGLSIVKELTTRMNGKVDCVSLPGKGSSFSVHFPQVKAPHE